MRGNRISTPDQVRQSILDIRGIYKELSDNRFATWYSNRYRVEYNAVKKVLEQGRVTP